MRPPPTSTALQGRLLSSTPVHTPLPLGVVPVFQSWNQFDASAQRWAPVNSSSVPSGSHALDTSSNLALVTWNVDAGTHSPRSRMASILSHILSQTPAPHVVFLQEVSRPALATLLQDPRLQQNWLSSEADESNWRGHIFMTMILLSKSRFGHIHGSSSPTALGLGPVWRVNYPSRFGRDALCCDILHPSTNVDQGSRIRLVNVHLDSLARQPSRRPQQLSTIASMLKIAGRGLVAGDFNPVLPEDATLVEENELIDAWTRLHAQEPGFTWGIDGTQAFLPCRLDKVAVTGLEPEEMEVMHPGVFSGSGDASAEHGEPDWGPASWSDHSGLRCCLRI
ncbi:endonuclease/exonuclease/phosphatase family protein [Ilyonectria sp. MPI-CAGE-AT-0026]|nr:endonuclease/exonuclease/phosphatase family protein [Ilyonectria sp. MPI-CAGE-AT-0026]